MDYVCGPVILYSQDKVRMLDFLSDVFEFDVDLEKDVVQNGAFFLKLVELPQERKETKQFSGIKFAFILKHKAELEEIISKYNFFLYRKGAGANDFIFNQVEDGLSIKDIDGRVWEFELSKGKDL